MKYKTKDLLYLHNICKFKVHCCIVLPIHMVCAKYYMDDFTQFLLFKVKQYSSLGSGVARIWCEGGTGRGAGLWGGGCAPPQKVFFEFLYQNGEFWCILGSN